MKLFSLINWASIKTQVILWALAVGAILAGIATIFLKGKHAGKMQEVTKQIQEAYDNERKRTKQDNRLDGLLRDRDSAERLRDKWRRD